MLLETLGQLDPLLAAFVSGQWRIDLRVPLHYTTVPLRLLADRYREAARRVWQLLQAGAPQMPDVPDIQPAPLPDVNLGSPYLPKLDVIRTVFQAAQTASDNAVTPEERHNALTLRLLLGLDVFCGLRSGETEAFPVVQIDLAATWQAACRPWPHFFLPEAKGNWWTTAARGLPLPRPLLQLAQEVLANSQGETTLFFFIGGERVPITPANIADQLDPLGVPRPRWHDGRHLLRCYLLERGLPCEAINFVLGHQAQGHEGLNPYRPFDLWQVWSTYESLVADLAARLQWREAP
jgi:integrase